MAESPPAWHCVSSGIIRHPSEPRVLLLPDGEGWALPSVTLAKFRWVADIDYLAPAMRELTGAETTALRYAHAWYDFDQKRGAIAYILENHSPDWSPPAGARWAGRAELGDMALASDEQRVAITRFFDELESGEVPPERPPWARPGWFARASAWVAAQLAERGHALAAPVEQLRAWSISTVLRARTAEGDFYLKAPPPLFVRDEALIAAGDGYAVPLPMLFCDEAALSATLGALAPDAVVAPVAIDRARGWMLSPDFGPTLRSQTTDHGAWAEALRRFARLQIGAVPHVDALLGGICHDRRLHVLREQIAPLLDDREALAVLGEEEAARLRSQGPRLAAMCDALAQYAVPQTLVHGDLHLGNIALRDGRYTFFDWTDGCVAHPFFDLLTVLPGDEAKEEEWAARGPMLEAYLSAWTGYEPIERLREAFEIAWVLGCLHHAVSYRLLVASLEPDARWELIDGLEDFVKRLAAALA